jgi:Protein of unknown function (DUF3892)
MDKWADNGISRVEYNSKRDRVKMVLVHEDRGDSIGCGAEWGRSRVVYSIENGKTFMTLTKDEDGEWKRGAELRIVTINDVKYIRTDQNNIEADDLGNLPGF